MLSRSTTTAATLTAQAPSAGVKSAANVIIVCAHVSLSGHATTTVAPLACNALRITRMDPSGLSDPVARRPPDPPFSAPLTLQGNTDKWGGQPAPSHTLFMSTSLLVNPWKQQEREENLPRHLIAQAPVPIQHHGYLPAHRHSMEAHFLRDQIVNIDTGRIVDPAKELVIKKVGERQREQQETEQPCQSLAATQSPPKNGILSCWRWCAPLQPVRRIPR